MFQIKISNLIAFDKYVKQIYLYWLINRREQVYQGTPPHVYSLLHNSFLTLELF